MKVFRCWKERERGKARLKAIISKQMYHTGRQKAGEQVHDNLSSVLAKTRLNAMFPFTRRMIYSFNKHLECLLEKE